MDHSGRYEPAKVFCDVLFDHDHLKYIFEYGFSWDADVTRLVFGRDIQKMRELANALPDTLYQNCANVPWSENVSGRQKRSNRRLVWKNHYRLFENQWFLELYGSYASYRSQQADEKLAECRKEGENFENCSHDGCCYRRICEARAWSDSFTEIAREGCLKDRDGKVGRQIRRFYRDVLKDTKKVQLKENNWHYSEGHEIFRSEGEYRRFREMLVFFAGFTPLSVLGWNFFKRLGDGRPEEYGWEDGSRWPQILIRDLPPDFGLEQEYLYRTMAAMTEDRFVEYEGKRYRPVRLVYRERDRNGLPGHLYLEAWEGSDPETANPKTACAVRMLPLYGGAYLSVGGHIPAPKTPKTDARTGRKTACDEQEKMVSFEVEFYYREGITDYLPERRGEFWKDFIVSQRTLKDTYRMDSPYHKDCTEWKIDVVQYRISEADSEGFLQFIRSFGDFAHLLRTDRMPPPAPGFPTGGSQKKGKADGCHSLLDPYSSDRLIESLRTGGMPPKRLPPREAELEWLAFLLREYPGFCRLFLDESCLERIAKRLDEEMEGKGWFEERRWDYRPRVRDMNAGFAAKYRDLLEIMRQGKILTYEWKDRTVRMYPYALEYDVSRHLTRRVTEPPLDVMCYDLDEKRNVLIRYDKIRVRTSASREDMRFSRLEKLYHVMAYALRCAEGGRQDIWGKASALLHDLWKEDPRGGDNYTRRVKKRFGRSWDFKGEYAKLEKGPRRPGDTETEEFLREIFAYWHEHEEEAGNELMWKYQTSLLICMTDACGQFRSPRASEKINDALDQITDAEVWELIGGKEKDGTVNEIAFYNEKLKNSRISFTLKDPEKESVELVYRQFGNYICAGELDPDGRLRFTVTYEAFQYRRIHMALMVLGDRIEDLEPEATAEVIRIRRNNRKKNTRR